MKQTQRNFWLDVIIFVSLLITTATGCGLWLVIPRGPSTLCLGVSRSTWTDAHICSAVVGLAGIVAHIVRHWAWLRALRGRRLSGLPEGLRLNRVVNRIMWFTYIATNVFGASAWALYLRNGIPVVGLPERLHAVSVVAWAMLASAHLALHWKWIAFTARRSIAPEPG